MSELAVRSRRRKKVSVALHVAAAYEVVHALGLSAAVRDAW